MTYPTLDTSIPRRVHTRIVFHDVGVALKDVTSLVDNLSCLSGALKGFVYRDFSIENVIWVGGVGKLVDFEYAKRIDSNTSSDVRTGTRPFMAVEVEIQKYLFFPPPTWSELDKDSDAPPPLRMNFLHDIESLWWAFAWTLFYHTDMETANSYDYDVHAQWNQYHIVFPVMIGRVQRKDFFTHHYHLLETCNKFISEKCRKVCGGIAHFAHDIRKNYKIAEAVYPSLALDDALLEIMHKQAAKHLSLAQENARNIELCPLPDLLKPKRSRPKNETSLVPTNQGKKKARIA